MTHHAVLFWFAASVGATLIVTNGSIFARVRDALPEGKLRTLAGCPMCAGFWFGAFWSVVLGSPAASLLQPLHSTLAHFADACASSLASEIAVAIWITIARIGNAMMQVETLAAEAKLMTNLLRYQKSVEIDQAPPPAPKTPSDPSIDGRRQAE